MTARTNARVLQALMALALLCLLAAAGLCLAPQPALAKEYGVASADIQATVGKDGILSVTEQRDYRFVGESSYVYWDFDGSAGQLYQFASVGEVDADGTFHAFKEGELGQENTYSIVREYNRVLLRLHISKADTHATFKVEYRVAGVVARYVDVGHLYWRFIPQGLTENQQIANVSCDIALPAPAGTQLVLGQGTDANMLAWSHGSLDATMDVADNLVKYRFPKVNSANNEYAEAVIAFPSGWLSQAAVSPWEAMPGILQQEGGWSSLANSVRLVTLAQLLGCVAIFLVVTGVCFLVFRRYGRNHRAHFKEEFWRDAPSGDHPAVIGYVWEAGEVRPSLLATTLLHLADQGQAAVTRELLPEELRTKRRAKTELVALNPAAAGQVPNAIDRAALDFFAFVANGQPVFAVEDVRAAARRDAVGFRNAYNAWHQAVCDQGKRAGYVNRNHKAASIGFGAVSLLMLCGSIAVLSMALVPGVGALTVLLAGVVPFACTVAVFAMALFSGRRNREATEVMAKCQAFNRWLAQLAESDEELSADMARWRHLFVCASATGSAEPLVTALRKKAPQVETSSGFQQPFGWCYESRERGGAIKMLGLDDVASVLADVAASVNCAGAGGSQDNLPA